MSYFLSQLMQSFKHELPRSLVLVPKWDLALVPHTLTRHPYEPLSWISFKHVTSKTIFFLLLASAGRRGDIHAIDPKRMTVSSTAVILPGYLMKVSSTTGGQTRFTPIVVRHLSAIINEAAELSLCLP